MRSALDTAFGRAFGRSSIAKYGDGDPKRGQGTYLWHSAHARMYRRRSLKGLLGLGMGGRSRSCSRVRVLEPMPRVV